MRMGPGKHLKGLTLMNGLVSPEEVCKTPFRRRPERPIHMLTIRFADIVQLFPRGKHAPISPREIIISPTTEQRTILTKSSSLRKRLCAAEREATETVRETGPML